MSHFHLCKFATAVFQLCSVFPLCLFAFERTEDRRHEGEVFDQTNTLPLWFFEPGLVCWGLLYEKQRFARSWKDHSRLDFLSSSSKWGLYKLIGSAMSGSRTNLLSSLPACHTGPGHIKDKRLSEREWQTVNDGGTNMSGDDGQRGRKWDRFCETDHMKQKWWI